ncbi:MAG: PLP-dependent transferase [Acidimicrobiia bacterium]|nr:PLP-dependent transferase [Acidimicrobiia bacterium]
MWSSTAYVTPTLEEGRRLATAVGAERFYSRYGNPSVGAFEDAVAALEGAEAARAFASGMGAVAAVVLGICSSGDHVVTQQQLYAGTQLLFEMVCPRFGIDVTFVDGTDAAAIEGAVQPGRTTLVLVETPANPKLDLVDLDAVGRLAGPVTVVDSTFATPLGQRPLDHGVDLVLHSATKGLAGHNDASLGVVAGSRELIDWIWGFAILQGANASAYDATNGLRGLRTLGPRFSGRPRPRTDSRPCSRNGPRSTPCATRVCRRIPSTSWPSGRWPCPVGC